MEWYYILIIFSASIHLLAPVMYVTEHYDSDYALYPFLLPRNIYDTTSVNWFGAVFLYALYFITTPLYAIGTFIYWCCTVGRK